MLCFLGSNAMNQQRILHKFSYIDSLTLYHIELYAYKICVNLHFLTMMNLQLKQIGNNFLSNKTPHREQMNSSKVTHLQLHPTFKLLQQWADHPKPTTAYNQRLTDF
uniref:Uncharacterized protein n=1 Tax=Opuntia streptacantha TaxID=393608 RepID=A0A7C9E621_OPUST